MLSKKEFEEACKAVIAKYPDSSSHRRDLSGWIWSEHPLVPGHGYMTRIVTYTWKLGSISTDPIPTETDTQYLMEGEEDDPATVDRSLTDGLLTCQQFVVYSATFQVPAFYFAIHAANGSPLVLSDLVRTTLFHPYSFSETTATTFGLTRANASFPLLSQGEHPTLGIPCWYLHPCESGTTVEELLSACNEVQPTALQRVVRWMELWFMVVGTAVNLHNTL